MEVWGCAAHNSCAIASFLLHCSMFIFSFFVNKINVKVRTITLSNWVK